MLVRANLGNGKAAPGDKVYRHHQPRQARAADVVGTVAEVSKQGGRLHALLDLVHGADEWWVKAPSKVIAQAHGYGVALEPCGSKRRVAAGLVAGSIASALKSPVHSSPRAGARHAAGSPPAPGGE